MLHILYSQYLLYVTQNAPKILKGATHIIIQVMAK